MNNQKIKLFPKNVYIYKKSQNEYGICVYICDTDNANEVIIGCLEDKQENNGEYIKLENGLNKVLSTNRYGIIHLSDIVQPLFIKNKHISISSKEFFVLTVGIMMKLVEEYSKNIFEYSKRNFEYPKLIDISFPENMIKLLRWNLDKLSYKFEDSKKLTIMEHCIYFANLGTNIGSEINKLRPVIVWRKHENAQNHNDDCYYIFPLSTKKSKTIYKHNVELKINGKYNKVMINQGRVISRKRFVKIFEDLETKKIIKLTENQKQLIQDSIKNYFGV